MQCFVTYATGMFS